MLSDSLTFVCGIERVSSFMMQATGAGHWDSWRGGGTGGWPGGLLEREGRWTRGQSA